MAKLIKHGLSSHPNPLQNWTPSAETILRWVTKTGPEQGEHWFMREGRGRRHNQRGHALITVRVKATEATGYRNSGVYCAARALIVAAGACYPPRTLLENVCGLPQCVNPTHWRANQPLFPWMIEVYANGDWQVVTQERRAAALRRVTARAADAAGIVHVLSIETWAKRAPNEPPRAICGAEFDPARTILSNRTVTCTKGC